MFVMYVPVWNGCRSRITHWTCALTSIPWALADRTRSSPSACCWMIPGTTIWGER